ncbi:MAG: 16S rRNA processing protein RimM [Candidatus Riflebacteria bacterium]|nr:16S rRNA processing protein RimM [Candidatus Riflebacteria bacterium]
MPTPATTPRRRPRPSFRPRKTGQAAAAGHLPGAAPASTGPVPVPAGEAGAEEWVVVGKVGRAIGLAGQVHVIPLTDHPGRFEPGARLFLRRPGAGPRALTVLDARDPGAGGRLAVRFEGVATPEDARALGGADLCIPRAERVPPPKGTFYPDELVGMAVHSPDGEAVGTVLSLENEVPSPYLTVVTPDHPEVLIPFRREFIRSIHRETRVVRLREPLDRHIPK